MTDEVREKLGRITGRHAAKKRRTVIRIAFARANQLPMGPVFRSSLTCNQRIWFQKWQYDERVQAALGACEARALEWADEETARVEDAARRELRQGVAEQAVGAPGALAEVMGDKNVAGNARIRAAVELMDRLDPERGTGGQGAIAVKVTEIDAEIERELANLAGGGEGADAGASAGDADAGGL